MTNNDVEQATKKADWMIWAHVAGVAYPVAILLIVAALFTAGTAWVVGGMIALFVATVAAVGFIGRFLKTLH